MTSPPLTPATIDVGPVLSGRVDRINDIYTSAAWALRGVDASQDGDKVHRLPQVTMQPVFGPTKPMSARIRMEAKRWIANAAIRDCLEAFSLLAEDAFRALWLKRNKSMGPSPAKPSYLPPSQFRDFCDERIERRVLNGFDKRGLTDKLRGLEQEYGITCTRLEHIETIQRLRNCLVHRAGVVERIDCQNAESVLRITFPTIKMTLRFEGEQEFIDASLFVQPDGVLKLDKRAELVGSWVVGSIDFPLGCQVLLTNQQVADILFAMQLDAIDLANATAANVRMCRQTEE